MDGGINDADNEVGSQYPIYASNTFSVGVSKTEWRPIKPSRGASRVKIDPRPATAAPKNKRILRIRTSTSIGILRMKRADRPSGLDVVVLASRAFLISSIETGAQSSSWVGLAVSAPGDTSDRPYMISFQNGTIISLGGTWALSMLSSNIRMHLFRFFLHRSCVRAYSARRSCFLVIYKQLGVFRCLDLHSFLLGNTLRKYTVKSSSTLSTLHLERDLHIPINSSQSRFVQVQVTRLNIPELLAYIRWALQVQVRHPTRHRLLLPRWYLTSPERSYGSYLAYAFP